MKKNNLLKQWLRAKNPLIQFVIGFLLIMNLYYLLTTFNELHSLLFKPILVSTAFLGSKLLNLLGQHTFSVNSVIKSDVYSLEMGRGCDALEPMIIFTAAVVAFPISPKFKFLGIVFGCIAIFSLNFIRVITLFLIGLYFPDWFNFFHLDFWQVFFILLAICSWFIWLIWVIKMKRIV